MQDANPTTPAPRGPGTQAVPPAGARLASVASSELLRGARMVEIRHNGEVYRLQATRLGKLILTK